MDQSVSVSEAFAGGMLTTAYVVAIVLWLKQLRRERRAKAEAEKKALRDARWGRNVWLTDVGVTKREWIGGCKK